MFGCFTRVAKESAAQCKEKKGVLRGDKGWKDEAEPGSALLHAWAWLETHMQLCLER